MREIIVCCLEFEITSEEIDALQGMIERWVQEYERSVQVRNNGNMYANFWAAIGYTINTSPRASLPAP